MRDDDLRDAFGALDRTVQESAPSFATITSPAGLGAARRRYRTRRALLLVAILLIPSAVVVRRPSTTPFDFERFSTLTGLDPGALSWEAPSDFLLNLPGSELLDAVPSIDIPVPVIRDDGTRAPGAKATLRRSSDL